jgi:uncharacterized protein (TIGR03437 family)
VGGSLSIESIIPGGGLFPAGTILQIQGAGFDATTSVAADGAAISSVQLVSPQDIAVTLGGQTEPAGKHFHVAARPSAYKLVLMARLATTLNGTQLLIDGAAAPLLYVSPDQVNAIVPFETATSGNANVQVVSYGQQGAAWDVPLAPSAPSIFTNPATGVGQTAVLDQDNSINGPANPAGSGTVIQIFATGEGIASPPAITGSITKGAGNTPLLSVTVSIGGIEAPVQYAGAAPGEVASLTFALGGF